MDSPVQNLALCLHRRRWADEGLSQNRAALSPHMFTQLAGMWAGPICRETVALECLHLTREGACTWLGESQGQRALLCPLGRSPYLKAECLRGPPDLTLPKFLIHLPDTRTYLSLPDPGIICLSAVWDGLKNQTPWCGKETVYVYCHFYNEVEMSDKLF